MKKAHTPQTKKPGPWTTSNFGKTRFRDIFTFWDFRIFKKSWIFHELSMASKKKFYKKIILRYKKKS